MERDRERRTGGLTSRRVVMSIASSAENVDGGWGAVESRSNSSAQLQQCFCSVS